MIAITRYTPESEKEWDDFVRTSKNGTFLLERSYMDYHHDRFKDHSLIFHDDKGPVALLPANEDGDTFCSHQGLTYGGLVMNERVTAAMACEIFTRLNIYLKEKHFRQVLYKAIPWIYHQLPAEEDLYALFKVCDARLTARDVASVIFTQRPVKWRRDRRFGAKRAAAMGIEVTRSDDYEGFWSVLTGNLQEKYAVNPVHSLEEIRLLSRRFPERIRLFVAKMRDRLLGGTVLYCCGQTVHVQYISASSEGKHLHAIDAIFGHLLTEVLTHGEILDFGKSTEHMGHLLNETLIYQKEGFGGRAVCYDWYLWGIKP